MKALSKQGPDLTDLRRQIFKEIEGMHAFLGEIDTREVWPILKVLALFAHCEKNFWIKERFGLVTKGAKLVQVGAAQ